MEGVVLMMHTALDWALYSGLYSLFNELLEFMIRRGFNHQIISVTIVVWVEVYSFDSCAMGSAPEGTICPALSRLQKMMVVRVEEASCFIPSIPWGESKLDDIYFSHYLEHLIIVSSKG